jgi:DNA (cytosine-5)-methyltransferase 1
MKALIGFAGFGGPDIALREAGIETTGIENDYAIAEVNRVNGGNVIVADILSIDPADFIGWLLYHFSPPCPSFSVASQSSETNLDISLARKICEFIRVGRPKFFTLENVWLYRKSLSWLLIWYTLLEEGYGVDAWNLNAADYGVPQSRRRMIVIGRRDGRRPAKPWPTYSKNPDMFTRPWVGWYEAIEDLLPSLPETNFADWQIDRMPEKLQETMLIGHSSQELGLARTDKPAFTVTTNSNRSRAFIINSQNASAGRALTVREDKSPMFTVTANIEEKNSPPKAFVVDCQYKNFNGERDLIIRTEDQPIFTMTASANRSTIRASLGQGRVVSMTPRCLARFQDFPDRFILPGDPGLDENIVLLLDSRSDRELACQGIGNALPPGLYRSVLRSLDLEA